MERLSTGIRINSAKDDAAGLAISTRMTANIRGMAAAIRNSNDGISLTQTAEGSLSAIQNNLQRIRELAVQSANSGNSVSDRASLNLEAQQMITEIDRVATNAAFNGTKLLDGTFKDNEFQVGAGNDSSDRIKLSIGNAKASALGTVGSTTGTSTSSDAYTGTVSSGALRAGDLAINGYAISASVNDGFSYKEQSASAIAKANAINASSSLTGVSAKANATVKEVTIASTGSSIGTGELLVNGVDIGSLAEAANEAGRASQLEAAINAVASQTGVTAAVSKDNDKVLTLTAADGRNITLNAKAISAPGIADLIDGDGGQETTYGSISLTSLQGESKIKITGTEVGLASIADDLETNLTENELSMTEESINGETVSAVNISTLSGAQHALSILDSAIDTITNSRANMGAYQNRFEAAISNLETTSTNLQASRSRILDTDYAKETTNLAKSQIVQQAATAMLAQANQSSQSVLALLK